jgi:regulator of sigma E protease
MAKPRSRVSKWSRAFMLAVAVAAVVYLIARHIDALGNVLLVLLGFGTVILVHEFGHFLFAKLSGIMVEIFSIGFMPTLFGFQRTEEGFRVRVLPGFLTEGGAKGDEGEGGEGENEDDAGEGQDEDEEDQTTAHEAPRAPCGDEEDEPDGSLLSFTIGRGGRAWDTEYCIGLIPIGGYVKMFGQDDTGPVKSTDDPRSFANKSTGARMAVIAAGVVFNVITAAIIFMIVFLIGIKQPPAVVGGVEPNSPAALAGLEPGDEIIEVNGKSYNLDFSDIVLAGALSGRDEQVGFKAKRDGSVKDFALTAEQKPGMPWKTFGIIAPQTLVVAEPADQVDVNDLLAHTGLAPGDVVKSVNGKDVQSYWEMASIVGSDLAPTVKLSVERKAEKGETKLIEARIPLEWMSGAGGDIGSESELYSVYSMVPRLQVTIVGGVSEKGARGGILGRVRDGIVALFIRKQEQPDARPDLKSGDIILAVGDVKNPTYKEMREVTEQYENKEMPLEVLRTDDTGAQEVVAVTVTPMRQGDSERVVIGIAVGLDAGHAVVAKTIDAAEGAASLDIPRGAVITAVDRTPVSSFYDVVREISKYPGEHITIDYRIDEQTAGAVALNVAQSWDKGITVKPMLAAAVEFEELRRLYKASGPVDAVAMGARKTVTLIMQTYLTIKRLVVGAVSPKGLMGPVGILAASYRTVAEKMWIEYLFLIGLINAAIAVFNFLPLPPLDGGLAVFLLIEKLKGSAVSERIQWIIVRVGLVLVLVLFLYVTLNDVIRNFFS